jgi:tyrosyl-tRNA synthetase
VNALTSPLLTKSDGKKFGKSEEGNIWLDPNLTSPYKFYQFWINADDQDISKFLRTFSLKGKKEIEDLESEIPIHPQSIKKLLAEELTQRIHSYSAYETAMKVSELLFNSKVNMEFLQNLSSDQYEVISGELPTFKINKAKLHEISIIELLAGQTSICSSNSEARKAIQNNAISINKSKISEVDYIIDTSHFIHDQWMMIENGKKNKYLVNRI